MLCWVGSYAQYTNGEISEVPVEVAIAWINECDSVGLLNAIVSGRGRCASGRINENILSWPNVVPDTDSW